MSLDATLNISKSGSPGKPGRFFFLIVLLSVHLAVTLLITKPGHISIDEVTYYLMAKSFTETGGLEIWNGYEEFPSAELQAVAQLKAREGRLVSKYPQIYAVIAAPFYLLAGLRGLFLLNSIAFLGAIYVTFLLAGLLVNDRRTALHSALILGLATYFWEYSQASWPHSLALFTVLASFYLGVRALLAVERPPWASAAAAGLVIGFGSGVRFDVILVLPTLCLIFLLSRPAHYRALLAIALAATPGLAFLSVTNHLKFGRWTPFTYGGSTGLTSGLKPYLSLAVLGAIAGTVTLLIRHRPDIRLWVLRIGKPGILVVALATILIPQSRSLVAGWLDGILQLIVDLRFRSLDVVEPVQRTASGALVHLGGLKKSLLQSCPFLTVTVIGFGTSIRERLNPTVWMMLLLPVTFIAVFSFFAWHGGTCLNQRYLLPALPFLAILTAYSAKKLSSGLGGNWQRFAAYSAFALALIFVLATSTLPEIDGSHEFFFLTIPLILSGLLLALSIVFIWVGTAGIRLRGLTATVLVLGLTWSALTTFLYDYPRSRLARKNAWEVSRSLDAIVKPDSLILADGPDIVANLKEKSKVRIAIPDPNVPGIPGDNYRDFRPLIDYHVSAGRPVYGIFRTRVWGLLEGMDLLDGLEMELIWEDKDFTAYRIDH